MKVSLKAALVALVMFDGSALGAAPPAGEAHLARLARDLASDDIRAREDASARLAECEAARPLLEAARKSPDAEVRRRAESAHRRLVSMLAKRGLDRVVPLVAAGRLDLLPEAAREWGAHDPQDRLFKAAAFAAERLALRGWPLMKTKVRLTSMPTFPARDLRKLLASPRHVRANADKIEGDGFRLSFAIGGTMLAPKVSTKSIVLLTGGYQAPPSSLVSYSIIIANGDVSLAGDVSSALVVSDGQVSLGDKTVASIVVGRRGVYEYGLGVGGCVLSSCRSVTHGIASKDFHKEEDAKRPLGYVRFFDVADVGLAVDSLAVKSVAPLSRLARAGLRKGDQFATVDGIAIRDSEELRGFLRKRFALGGTGVFVVERDGKQVTLRARLAGD
ncbi:MAG: hypothetical protein K2W96_17480 [Gemmataceae bacterium]|nr:hypothetical protein [Gemmataceae bacterium]